MTNEEREEIHNQYRWHIMHLTNTIKILRESIRQYRMYWKIRHIERVDAKCEKMKHAIIELLLALHDANMHGVTADSHDVFVKWSDYIKPVDFAEQFKRYKGI